MKTISKVVNDRSKYSTLIRAVVSHVGKDSIQDIVNHGIDGGFNGFIYTAETVAFYKKHKADILKMAKNLADDLGEDMLTMIAGFNCLKDSKFDPNEIGAAIYAGEGEHADYIRNAMAWFAAEEVCRMFEE